MDIKIFDIVLQLSLFSLISAALDLDNIQSITESWVKPQKEKVSKYYCLNDAGSLLNTWKYSGIVVVEFDTVLLIGLWAKFVLNFIISNDILKYFKMC